MERLPTLEKPSLAQILQKHSATSMKDLHLRIYMSDDQIRMKNGTWDYGAPSVCTTVYTDVLKLDENELSEEDREWRRETLYFWNHHAVSCAIWRYRDLEAARRYVTTALSYQDSKHPNHITKLFMLLLEHKEKEAMEWVESIPDEVEKETARDICTSYRSGWV
jgi:hypothetical protein